MQRRRPREHPRQYKTGKTITINQGRRFTKPTKIQSLIFERSRYTAKEAQRWARNNDFPDKMIDDSNPNTIRIRVRDPEMFDQNTFRVIPFGPGVQATIAVPK